MAYFFSVLTFLDLVLVRTGCGLGCSFGRLLTLAGCILVGVEVAFFKFLVGLGAAFLEFLVGLVLSFLEFSLFLIFRINGLSVRHCALDVNAVFLLVFLTGFGLGRTKISSIAELEFEDIDGGFEPALVVREEGGDCKLESCSSLSSLAWNALDGPNSRSDIRPGFRG